MIGATGCAVVLHHAGRLEQAGGYGTCGPLPAAATGDHPLARAVRTRETQWTSTPMAVPLPLSDRVIGAVGMWFADGPPDFDGDQRAAFVTAASQCAQALDRARLHQAEHEVAEVLQRSLLPAGLPPLARLAGAARYTPATEHALSGGDWYDMLQVGDTAVALVVGDVVGHGPPAAAVMGQLRSVLAAHLLEGCSPAAALERLDRFAARVAGAAGSTCACLLYDWSTGVLRWALAGHPPVLLVDGPDTRFLDGPGAGAVLGVRGRPALRRGQHDRARPARRSCSTPTASWSAAARSSTRACSGSRTPPAGCRTWARPSWWRPWPTPRWASRARPTTSRCWWCAPFPRRSQGRLPARGESMRVLRRAMAVLGGGGRAAGRARPRTWSWHSARPRRTPPSTPTPVARAGSSRTRSPGAPTGASRCRSATTAAGGPCRRTTATVATGCGSSADRRGPADRPRRRRHARPVPRAGRPGVDRPAVAGGPRAGPAGRACARRGEPAAVHLAGDRLVVSRRPRPRRPRHRRAGPARCGGRGAAADRRPDRGGLPQQRRGRAARRGGGARAGPVDRRDRRLGPGAGVRAHRSRVARRSSSATRQRRHGALGGRLRAVLRSARHSPRDAPAAPAAMCRNAARSAPGRCSGSMKSSSVSLTGTLGFRNRRNGGHSPPHEHRRHRRTGKHRHRPARQAGAQQRDRGRLHGRGRGVRRAGAGAPAGDHRLRRGRRLAAAPGPAARHRLRGHLRRRAPRARAALRRGRHPGRRPHPGARRAHGVPAGQRRRPPGRPERLHDHLWRPGDHPDRARGLAGHPGALRGDRRVDRVALRRSRHPRQHRRVHPHHRQGRRAGRRGRPRARRSSSSTRWNRR